MNVTVPPLCASANQMITRTALLFRANVYVNDAIFFLTLFLSVWAMRKLKKRTIFSDSTHVLIWISLLIVNGHGVTYGFIQNWSLFRSFAYSDEPCKIMFNEYECFPFYTANILSRLLLLFTNCALTVDRLITLFFPRIPSNYTRGYVLFIISLTASMLFCYQLTKDGPNDNLQPNCFQRMGRNIEELKNQVLFYFYVGLTCLILNVVAWVGGRILLSKRNFQLNEQYSKQESVHSALVISIILVFQTICLGFYSLSVVYILEILELFDPLIITNLVIWFYTYPWAALSLPTGILISTKFISIRRRQKIDVLTAENKNENQNAYFLKLNHTWGDGGGRASSRVGISMT